MQRRKIKDWNLRSGYVYCSRGGQATVRQFNLPDRPNSWSCSCYSIYCRQQTQSNENASACGKICTPSFVLKSIVPSNAAPSASWHGYRVRHASTVCFLPVEEFFLARQFYVPLQLQYFSKPRRKSGTLVFCSLHASNRTAKGKYVSNGGEYSRLENILHHHWCSL